MNSRKDALGYLFGTSSKYYKRAVNKEMEKYDLTAVQCGVIRILLHEGELSQAEIADIFASDRATIGTVIQKLEEKHFIEKKLSISDRRSYVVSLTSKSREIAGVIDKASEKVTEKTLKGLTEEEKKTFYKVLDTIIRNLDE